MAFLGARQERGSKNYARIQIGEFLDGSPVTIPVATITGASSGPTVAVLAGIHGDESTGIEICRRLIDELDPADMTGSVVAVPVANIPSHLSRTRGFLHEERWLVDINRVFPGDASGLLTHRIAAVLLEEFVTKADLTVDLHSALDGCVIAPFTYVDPADDDAGTLDVRERMAELVGTDYVYRKSRHARLGTSELSGSIATHADKAGSPYLLVEMGESRRVTQEYVPIGVAGMRKVLRGMGVESGPITPREKAPRSFSRVSIVHSERGGGVRLEVDLGDEVQEGQLVGQVVDIFGRPVEQVTAPASGFVLRTMKHASAASGAELIWIAGD